MYIWLHVLVLQPEVTTPAEIAETLNRSAVDPRGRDLEAFLGETDYRRAEK